MTEDPLKDFMFIDQLKIMGYGESDSSGCWIKFQLTPELLEIVRGRKGEMVEVAARLLDNAGQYVPTVRDSVKVTEPGKYVATKEPGDDKPIIVTKLEKFVDRKVPEKYASVAAPNMEKPGENGQFWRKLIAHGTFNAPPVLKMLGDESDYRAWIQNQLSCLTDRSDWVEKIAEGRCEYAHVRRIEEGSGTSIKPSYFGVPLTHKEHHCQHSHGEEHTLSKYRPKKKKDDFWTKESARDWFTAKAHTYRLEWATYTLIEMLGFERRRDCPPEPVMKWFTKYGLMQYYPDKAEA